MQKVRLEAFEKFMNQCQQKVQEIVGTDQEQYPEAVKQLMQHIENIQNCISTGETINLLYFRSEQP